MWSFKSCSVYIAVMVAVERIHIWTALCLIASVLIDVLIVSQWSAVFSKNARLIEGVNSTYIQYNSNSQLHAFKSLELKWMSAIGACSESTLPWPVFSCMFM